MASLSRLLASLSLLLVSGLPLLYYLRWCWTSSSHHNGLRSIVLIIQFDLVSSSLKLLLSFLLLHLDFDEWRLGDGLLSRWIRVNLIFS